MHQRTKIWLAATVGYLFFWLVGPFFVRNYEAFMEKRGWDQLGNQLWHYIVTNYLDGLPWWVSAMAEYLPTGFWAGAFTVLAVWGILEVIYAWRRRKAPPATVLAPVSRTELNKPRALITAGSPATPSLIEHGLLRGREERRRWWAELTAAMSARDVAICLDLEECRGGAGPITWREPQRLILGTKDVIAPGETIKIPLVDEFQKKDGGKFIAWCLRGYEHDAKARMPIGTTSARCRLFLESADGKEGSFRFYLPDRLPDEPPRLTGEHLLDFGKEWRG
jgi:hypothetical protein